MIRDHPWSSSSWPCQGGLRDRGRLVAGVRRGVLGGPLSVPERVGDRGGGHGGGSGGGRWAGHRRLFGMGDTGVRPGVEAGEGGERPWAGVGPGEVGGEGRGSVAVRCSLKCLQSCWTPAVAQVASIRSVRCPSFSEQS